MHIFSSSLLAGGIKEHHLKDAPSRVLIPALLQPSTYFKLLESSSAGEVKEHHLKDAPYPPTDTKTHVYTLTIRPDNTFEVLVDGDSKASGSLLEMLEPPINPPKASSTPRLWRISSFHGLDVLWTRQAAFPAKLWPGQNVQIICLQFVLVTLCTPL